MVFSQLVEIVGKDPVFETGLLLSGNVDPAHVRRQLSRWVKSGKIIQLRRGLYALARPYRKVEPHPFLVANRLVLPSYVSLQSALDFHGLIPERVPTTTSVTTRRPGRRDNELGMYYFQHIKLELFHGYTSVELVDGQRAFVATAEKALIDLIHLRPGGDSPEYLAELRLQNLDHLDLAELEKQARESSKPKLQRAAALVRRLADAEAREYQSL